MDYIGRPYLKKAKHKIKEKNVSRERMVVTMGFLILSSQYVYLLNSTYQKSETT